VIWNASPPCSGGCPRSETVTGNTPGRPAERRMALDLPETSEQVSGRQSTKRNKGPGWLPLCAR